MDSFVDERDFKLLGNDKYTFFVLRRIIEGKCRLLLTDHKRLIICFTNDPFPIWIWTPDDVTDDEMENVYKIIKEHNLLDGEHRFNLKYKLAEFFIQKAAEEGIRLGIKTNLLAYDCLKLVPPSIEADGSIYRCDMGDLDEVVEFLDQFHQEVGADQRDYASYKNDVQSFIRTANMYLWKNRQGINVASCKYVPLDDLASINFVYTRPEYRRKHYAENLVYQVTKLAMQAGYTPMLYTDADYRASNACYEKLGYKLQGKLCTIG